MSKTNQPHPHAELMLQYAQDAQETDKPWERWEWYDKYKGKWKQFANHPTWGTVHEIRRKPKTVLINGREVVAPVDTEPKKGETYYLAYPAGSYWYECFTWKNEERDYRYFERGLIFKTREDAIAYAQALVSCQGD